MRSGWGCCGGSAPDRDGGAPAQRAEDVRLDLAYRGVVVFYAVISDEIHQVIEFFGTPAEAEAMLEMSSRTSRPGETFSTSSRSSL